MRNSLQAKHTLGFTLVELIVVILLLGILTVLVAPRFQSKGSVVEYTYQSRLISALRTMQQRAMNDTRAGYCFQVNVFTGSNSSFGPPTLNYRTGGAAATCANTIDSSEAADYVTADIDEFVSDKVIITSGAGTINFNSLGCPNNGAGFCNNPVKITIQGVNTLSVCVESQGYIHACD
ncbi:type II secretion system protein [Aliiglaciecola sp. LCG003]|uniref:type II secretion system protein n=1 Tax=Aliiglaciecola sp. LCG003 TaxID=3053655 RepID=UPI00257249D8|nr:type II secretion system protein [Aliiglaciecola sp. LCG003]WJG09711.1 type II secretion system protein [Aliiglaciecola sp. LCG003]